MSETYLSEEEKKRLFETAGFGVEIEHFITGPVGQYLIAMANQEAEEAVEEMKTVDVSDTEAVRKVQDKLNTPNKVMDWLERVVKEGRESHDILREAEEAQR